MVKEGITISIEQRPFCAELGIYIVDRRGNDLSVAGPVDLEFHPYKEGDEVKPTLSIPFWMAEEFMQAFVDELSNNGVKTKNELTMEGELNATKYHLEDMRKLVFEGGGKMNNEAIDRGIKELKRLAIPMNHEATLLRVLEAMKGPGEKCEKCEEANLFVSMAADNVQTSQKIIKMLREKDQGIREIYEKYKDKDFPDPSLETIPLLVEVTQDMWTAIKKHCEEGK